jgi:hypothetical protein
MPGPPPFDVRFDPGQFRQFQRDLQRLAPEVRKELNKALREIAGAVADDAKSRASWSSRIPGAIGITVTTTKVGVKANRNKAPHAAAYEGFKGGRTVGSFRHPVYGNRSVWVQQPTRPFLAPAVKAYEERFYDAAGAAIDDAGRAAGWR